MKTVRFAELVATAGAPESYQLWMPPAKDPVFQRAVKAHRVLTVHQENVGTKKDFGVIGFHEEPHARFLVFPKSIREFEGRRVVGVKYGLLAPDSRPTLPRKAAPSADEAKPAPRRTAATAARSSGARKILRFEAPAAIPPIPGTSKKPPAAGLAPSRSLQEQHLLAEVTRALAELERGQAVAAYKRLQRLVEKAAAR